MSSQRLLIIIDPKDNVATALAEVSAGQDISIGSESLIIANKIEYGHKFALKDLAVGDFVIKYGAQIGRVTKAIKQGEHVHVHNVEDIVDEVRKG